MKPAADKTIRETLNEERRVDLLTLALSTLEKALTADKGDIGAPDWSSRVKAANSLLDHLEFKPPTRIVIANEDEFFKIKIEDDEDDPSE